MTSREKEVGRRNVRGASKSEVNGQKRKTSVNVKNEGTSRSEIPKEV